MWKALTDIPPGETASYAQIADSYRRMGAIGRGLDIFDFDDVNEPAS